MLADLGRKADAALTRGTDVAGEAVHVTALHLRRIVGAVSVALARVTREAQDLAWDYQDVAADLRRRPADLGTGPQAPQAARPVLRLLGPEG